MTHRETHCEFSEINEFNPKGQLRACLSACDPYEFNANLIRSRVPRDSGDGLNSQCAAIKFASV